MSSNPEFPEQPTNLPTAGENPNTAGHLNNIPYDKVPMEKAVLEGELRESVDTGELMQVQTGEYWSPRQPAQELPTPTVTESAPKTKNKKLKMVLGGVAAGVGVTIASAAVYVNAITSSIGLDNTQDKNLPPAPETSNSANPFPTQAGETQGTPVIETKFYDKTGAELTKEELSESVRLTVDKYPDGPDAMRGFFEKMEVMMNHFPSEAEVRNNLGYAADKKLTKQDYLDAAAIYRKAYDSIYEHPNGKLYSEMNRLGASAVGYHYDTMNEAEPYYISLELPKGSDIALVSDNSLKNSVKDDSRTVRFSTYGGDAMERSIGMNGKQPAWMIPGNIDFKQLPN